MPPYSLDIPVRRCRPSEDVIPFSECRNNLSACIARARDKHRTMLVTQNGNAAAYIVNARDFDDLMDKIDLWRDVATSRREIAEGKGIPHEEVFSRLHDKLMRMKAGTKA